MVILLIYIGAGFIATIIAVIPSYINLSNNDNELSLTSSKIFKNGLFYLSFTLIFGIFTLLAGTRYFVGTDYTTYTEHQIPQTLFGIQKNQYSVEFLYSQLIKLGSAMGSYQWIFALTHIIIVFFVLLYVAHRSVNYSVSIYIFVFSTFFNFSLNGMRQSIATAIFLYATQYIVKKKPFWYFGLIIVAILFHKSAIIYLPFYLLTYVNLTKSKGMLWGILIATPILLLNLSRIHSLIYLVSSKFGFYTKFFGSVYDTGNISNMNVMLLFANIVVLFLIYFFAGSSGQKKLRDGEYKSDALRVDYNIQVLTTLFSTISFAVPGSFRIFYMLMPIQMSLVPNLLSTIVDKRLRLLMTIVLFIMYFIIFMVIIVWWNQNETLPYQSIINW